MVRHAQVRLVQDLLDDHHNRAEVLALPTQLLDVVDRLDAAVRAGGARARLSSRLLLSLLIYTDIYLEETHLGIYLLGLDAQLPEVELDYLGLLVVVIFVLALGLLRFAALLKFLLLRLGESLLHLNLVDDFEVGHELDDGHVRCPYQLDALHLALVFERHQAVVQLLHGSQQLLLLRLRIM